MLAVKTKPFQVTSIPGLNEEWIDIHLSESGNICVQSSNYAEASAEASAKAICAVEITNN